MKMACVCFSATNPYQASRRGDFSFFPTRRIPFVCLSLALFLCGIGVCCCGFRELKYDPKCLRPITFSLYPGVTLRYVWQLLRCFWSANGGWFWFGVCWWSRETLRRKTYSKSRCVASCAGMSRSKLCFGLFFSNESSRC